METGEILRELTTYNPWWITGKIEGVPEFKRIIFEDVLKTLDSERITGIIGPRRVGKTTIIYQVIEYLLKKGVPSRDILFLQFDNPLMAEDERIIPKIIELFLELHSKENKKYIFFDEIQYVKDWSRWLKASYDLGKQINFIISGSSSTLLYKNTSESLVGRIEFTRLSTLFFLEYLLFFTAGNEQLHEILKIFRKDNELLFRSPSQFYQYLSNKQVELEFLKRECLFLFEEYIFRGGIIATIAQDWQISKKWLKEDYLGLVLYRDLLKIYPVRDIKAMEEMIYFLIKTHGSRLNYTTLSNTLGLRIETVKQYLSYLESVNLIHLFHFYSQSIKQQLRAEKKCYVFDSSIVNAVRNYDDRMQLSSDEMGHLVEGIVANHLQYKFSDIFTSFVHYWSEKGKQYEVDFVIEINKGTIPLEVKYQTTVELKKLTGMKKFRERFGNKDGIVVTKDYLDCKEGLLFIPVWLFLLTM